MGLGSMLGGVDDAVKAVKSGQALDTLLDMGRGAKQQVTNAAANMGASANEAIAAGNVAAKETMEKAMGGVTAGANRAGDAIEGAVVQGQMGLLDAAQNPIVSNGQRQMMEGASNVMGQVGGAGRMVTDAVAAHPKRAMGAAALAGLGAGGAATAGGVALMNSQGQPIIVEEDY